MTSLNRLIIIIIYINIIIIIIIIIMIIIIIILREEIAVFAKKSFKDRSPSIFAGRLYLLQTHPLGQKPWNTTYWCW